MRLLLDTNALLWLLSGDERLGDTARSTVIAAESLSVSAASLWEIAIKVALGKLGPVPRLHQTIKGVGFSRLGIEDRHLDVLVRLPMHHRDPFDRLLISQAQVEGLTILTSDREFSAYSVMLADARA